MCRQRRQSKKQRWFFFLYVTIVDEKQNQPEHRQPFTPRFMLHEFHTCQETIWQPTAAATMKLTRRRTKYLRPPPPPPPPFSRDPRHRDHAQIPSALEKKTQPHCRNNGSLDSSAGLREFFCSCLRFSIHNPHEPQAFKPSRGLATTICI